MVFFGEYQVAFTAPGRIVLPKKIRELLQGSVFVLSKGFDTCLAGFNKEDWEARSEELMTVSLLERENLDKKRFLFASAVYIETDDQGRFVIPKNLLQYAGLSEKAVIVGVGDHFEVWNIETWDEYLKKVKN